MWGLSFSPDRANGLVLRGELRMWRLISCHLLKTSNQVICVMIRECLLGVYVYGLARLVQFSSHDIAYVTLI